jgi:hypothetical protein
LTFRRSLSRRFGSSYACHFGRCIEQCQAQPSRSRSGRRRGRPGRSSVLSSRSWSGAGDRQRDSAPCHRSIQHRRVIPFPLALPFFAVMALNYRRCCDSARRQCHLDLPYVQGQIAPAVQAGILSNFLDCSLRARAIMSNPSLVCY